MLRRRALLTDPRTAPATGESLAYRHALLGDPLPPLALWPGLLVALAVLLAPVDVTTYVPKKHSAWVEFHAAIGIVACGALTLASVKPRDSSAIRMLGVRAGIEVCLSSTPIRCRPR